MFSCLSDFISLLCWLLSSSTPYWVWLPRVSALGCLVVFPSHLLHLTSPSFSTPRAFICVFKALPFIHSTNIHWINILTPFFPSYNQTIKFCWPYNQKSISKLTCFYCYQPSWNHHRLLDHCLRLQIGLQTLRFIFPPISLGLVLFKTYVESRHCSACNHPNGALSLFQLQ